MKAAWDLGINTIDTANVYSNGESERLVVNKVSFLLRVVPETLLICPASIKFPAIKS